MCDCLKITYQKSDELVTVVIETYVSGILNGYNTWEVVIDGTTYYIWHDNTDNWYISEELGSIENIFGSIKSSEAECPLAEIPVWVSIPEDYVVFTTEEGTCADPCYCIEVTYRDDEMDDEFIFQLAAEGTYNARNYYLFTINGHSYVIYHNGVDFWILAEGSTPGEGEEEATLFTTGDCPFKAGSFVWKVGGGDVELFDVTPCGLCNPKEDRIFREYKTVKLPVIFEEENRGFFRCCCNFLVLASNTADSWKNDVTSAWVKLSDPEDTVTAVLKKGCCADAEYQPVPVAFVNEENAFYWTIPWKDVLASDGPGCYKIVISYNISGIEQEFTWGVYDLKPYSIENANTTARVRAIFNSYQEIEGINFTGSMVEDTIRFFGFIGNRQPNTEIDNLIYQNREVKKVVRENLNSYEILTDPTCEEHINKLTDLYLLSENQLFISDYNAHNHSYRYQDVPVIVENSPEITYFELSRAASLKCVVGDKFKNKRSFYK